MMLHVKFGFDWPSGFMNIVDDNDYNDGRTSEHGYSISLPCEPNGSGELKSLV